MNKQWKCFGIRQKGLRHEYRGLECQDIIDIKEFDGKISMALLDGRGDSDVNALAVPKIAERLNEFVICLYERIYSEDKEAIAYNLMLQIERCIEELSKELQEEYKELASTLLVFCMDKKSNTYCCLHLGDGAIAVKDSRKKIWLLSQPTNGENDRQTVLSTSECAVKYVKLYRGQMDDIEEIMMVSDGLFKSSDEMEQMEYYFSKEKGNVILERDIDDQSLIKMYRTA